MIKQLIYNTIPKTRDYFSNLVIIELENVFKKPLLVTACWKLKLPARSANPLFT